MINEAVLTIQGGNGLEVYIIQYSEISRGKPNADGTRSIVLKGDALQVFNESTQIPLSWRNP